MSNQLQNSSMGKRVGARSQPLRLHLTQRLLESAQGERLSGHSSRGLNRRSPSRPPSLKRLNCAPCRVWRVRRPLQTVGRLRNPGIAESSLHLHSHTPQIEDRCVCMFRGTIMIRRNTEPGNVASDDKAIQDGGGGGGGGLKRGLEIAYTT